LELAHGHAPFSKYPPMKVLLMTLQNAPPGLDHDRDKRFSKSFKEMIAMCLVKDPAKRPTAEKLLRHSFFKHARTPDYIARNVLDGLAPLWERVKALKVTDAARLAEKKMPFDEQEERSQTEYKRGVSSWNFNVEDLKAQAALIQDDDDSPPQTVKGDDELSKQLAQDGGDDAGDALPHVFSPSAELPSVDDSSADRFSGPVIIHPINAETANDVRTLIFEKLVHREGDDSYCWSGKNVLSLWVRVL
jgi:serine/threonine protein kinase